MERKLEIEESSQHLLEAQVGDKGPHDYPSNSYLDAEDAQIKPRKHSQFRRWIIFIARGFILILALYGAFEFSSRVYGSLSFQRHRISICDCGSSIAEAKIMRCEYVPVAAAWLPPHCRDKELEEEFDRSGPGINGEWAYYADHNGTRKYSRDEMANFGGVGGDFRIYTSRAWHIVHCVYYWKKQIRLSQTGAIMEPRFAGEGHANHCLEDFLDPINPELIAAGQQISLTSSGQA